MIYPTYSFSLKELKKYETHGLVHADLSVTLSIFSSFGMYINLKDLLEIERPKHVWHKETSNIQTVYISTGKQKPKASAIEIDPDIELDKLLVSWTDHPKGGYCDVNIDII